MTTENLYLLIGPMDSGKVEGDALILCRYCRGMESFDVSLPLCLVTPRLVLGLQRLRRLNGNLSRLLQGGR
ncbi:MAG: hypothetical protein ACR2PL_22895 [Dehalococcoidia bacterium]